MGFFDCYCALCSGPLSIYYVKLGSKRARDIKKRQKRVQLLKRKRAGESVDIDDIDDGDDDAEMEDASEIETEEASPEESSDDEDDKDYAASSASSSPSDDSEYWEDSDPEMLIGGITDMDVPPPEPEVERDDTWSQTSDLSVEFDFYNKQDPLQDPRDFYYEETRSYDPIVLSPKDLTWLDRCRCLAFNAAATGVTKAFISGRGRYSDYGSFDVRQPGRDPNDTGEDYHTCFHTSDTNETVSFPFHETCYYILARSLGYTRQECIDKDAMYTAMRHNVQSNASRLDLDYGCINGVEQSWECQPGEEFSVCDPGPRLNFTEVLRGLMPAKLLDGAPIPLDLTHKVRDDPFAVLPYDILHDIFDLLSIESAKSLMNASYHVFTSTRASNTVFWRHMLRSRVSPWFWELNDFLLESTLPPTFNYQYLFHWLNKKTTPEFGMTGEFMGIANRRRIWRVCQQLVPSYKDRVAPVKHKEPDDEEAQSILDSAVSLHMPIVLYPQPKDLRTMSTQFIRSWSEIGHSCDFDTYWNPSSILVGIAITFSSTQRVFGSTDGSAGQPLHIDAGDWIQSITAYMGHVNRHDEGQDRSTYLDATFCETAKDAGIEGLKVTLTSGKTKTLKRHRQCKGLRPFIVLPNMAFIGFTGQIAANGMVSRLGILQAPRRGVNLRSGMSSYTPSQKMLWSLQAESLPHNNEWNRPIWAHPTLRLTTFGSPSQETASVPFDMLPHEILLWAESPAQYQYLNRISCFEVVSGKCTNHEESWDIPDIVGIWPGKTHKSGLAAHIGSSGPVPCQHPDFETCQNPSELKLNQTFKRFEEANMRHFAIDGPGGEVVSEVHVSDGMRAIKLFTNRGRECYWGLEGCMNWQIKRAEKGEFILGLSCSFGTLSGWSQVARVYSHWRLSNLGVITVRTDEGGEFVEVEGFQAEGEGV
ncbi:hypothetical protein K504DRAFT_463925 [Pleomassaria siparia CBS 279.74]|uniref:F-box domain-containing protein n=1 Tax=Pleomassaria siparia CBS 279.74 TaxID=1314801 RepID=A0A6G1JQI9_9PLEO|nr:hypothetical protein K504DRAFT_463925 [Pleomassaria siparia CBS 279.74]